MHPILRTQLDPRTSPCRARLIVIVNTALSVGPPSAHMFFRARFSGPPLSGALAQLRRDASQRPLPALTDDVHDDDGGDCDGKSKNLVRLPHVPCRGCLEEGRRCVRWRVGIFLLEWVGSLLIELGAPASIQGFECGLDHAEWQASPMCFTHIPFPLPNIAVVVARHCAGCLGENG
ncbi:hypothetical protein N657DRAFT_60990 [Parathielavia appendiculata]|uniref:Uncharacterized protein n=1 Tax=Parathielavia appendiculata TaxID=2587402 RepID=A0AAN6UA00_9PEZI|nr:hypothetical protein N657DRAFT_60990 [Parathielavia appendiculata]